MHSQAVIPRATALNPAHCMLQAACSCCGSAARPLYLCAGGSTHWGRADTKLYLYNGLTMMAVFFICRNVMGVGEPTL